MGRVREMSLKEMIISTLATAFAEVLVRVLKNLWSVCVEMVVASAILSSIVFYLSVCLSVVFCLLVVVALYVRFVRQLLCRQLSASLHRYQSSAELQVFNVCFALVCTVC